MVISDLDSNRDFFKKPLKLLKKKLDEQKRKKNKYNNSNVSASFTNESSRGIELDKLYRDEPRNHGSTSNNRLDGDNSQGEAVIQTSIAQAERDRYVHQRRFMDRQRQEEKARW